MNVISRCQAIYRTARLASPDISGSQHSLVLAVCKNPGASQEELARLIALNKSTVARFLSGFEERGYVTRVTDGEDKRVSRVYPTEKMLALYPREREVTDEWNRLICEGIPEGEIEVFRSVLSKMELRSRELCWELGK
jgi:DNA-binding MarR family transcriptional regulator